MKLNWSGGALVVKNGVAVVSASVSNVPIGDSDPHSVSQIGIFVKGNAWTGSIIPQGRLQGSARAVADLQNLGYMKATTRVVTDPGVTPITADGIYYIFVDGCEAFLDIVVTAGTVEIELVDVKG